MNPHRHCEAAAREQFLEGYRCGLGAAIRAMDVVRAEMPRLRADETGAVAVTVLSGLMSGLRQISASVVLDDEKG